MGLETHFHDPFIISFYKMPGFFLYDSVSNQTIYMSNYDDVDVFHFPIFALNWQWLSQHLGSDSKPVVEKLHSTFSFPFFVSSFLH